KIPVRHGDAFRLAGEFLWGEPVAEALNDFRSRSVGVFDGEGLGFLIALHASSQQHESGKLALRQRDGLATATGRVELIGGTEVEQYAAKDPRRSEQVRRAGVAGAVEASGGIRRTVGVDSVDAKF